MRVSADTTSALQSCGEYRSVQAEDYAVRVVGPELPVDKGDPYIYVIYSASRNQLSLRSTHQDKIFGEYQIFDMSGRLIQQSDSKTNIIDLKMQLLKGGYIINFTDAGVKVSIKFLNNAVDF